MPDTATAINSQAPAKRQRIEGNLHRSLPATLTIRAAEEGAQDDGLLRLRLSASSDTPYLRVSYWDDPWIEVLGHKDGEVQLERLNGGAAVLANHDRYTAVGDTPLAAIGAVEKAWLEGGRMLADLVISRRQGLADLRQDIADGLVRNVSIGYQINERTLTRAAPAKGQPDEYRVTSWTPFEISLVDIPADATVGLGRQATEQQPPRYRVVDLPPAGPTGTQQERTMPDVNIPAETQQPAAPVPASHSPAGHNSHREADGIVAERQRAQEIRALGRSLRLPDPQIDQAVDNGLTVDEFRAQAINGLVKSGMLRPAESPDIGLTEKEAQKFSFCRLMLAAMDPMNARDLAPFELECSRAAQDKRDDSRPKLFGNLNREAAITIPYDVLSRGIVSNEAAARDVSRQLIQRAMQRGGDAMHMMRDLVVGTPTAGGNLVATELLGSSFIELLRNAMVLDLLGITWLRDLNGNIAIPSHTGAATAYWFTEGNAPTETQQTVGQATLTPKTVGAWTDYSRRLLLQSSIDVEMFVRADLAMVIGLALQSAVIAGASNGPTGILATSGIGSVADAGGNGSAPDYDDMVDLETAVANANADLGRLAFLTNTKVRGKLRKTQEFSSTNGKPVWTSMAGRPGVGEVLGYEAIVTNSVPSNLTAGTSSGVCSGILFGNWADVLIGMWGGLDVMLDPYALSTSGGKRIVALQDCDSTLRHVASMAAKKDALTT